MSGEKDLEQLKKEAAAKAREAALAKMKAKETTETGSQTEAETPTALTGEDGLDLAKKKAAAAAKAKATALAKMKAKEQTVSNGDSDDAEEKAAALAKKKAMEQPEGEPPEEGTSESTDEADLAKKKAAAAAKAKAAALAKMKAKEQAGASNDSEQTDEKAKAIAAAKAKAAAATKAKAAAKAKQVAGEASDDEKAKAIAAAKAKAAAAAKAKAAAAAKANIENEAAEKKLSPNQPYLDKYVKIIGEHLGTDVLEDYYINPLSKDVPTIVAKRDAYFKVAEFLKYNEQLQFDYLSELHGTDFETHMEVYVHLYSYKKRQSVALKVKIDRDKPTIDSLAPLWAGANWPECEAYDLLGIKFTGHPNLHRIMLGEEWVGHPLRKDYEPYDVEV